MANVAIIFGGVSPEHDISILTGLQAERGVDSRNHRVIPIFVAKNGDFFVAPNNLEAPNYASGAPKDSTHVNLVIGNESGFYTQPKALGKARKIEIDVVVNCLHGGPGEDGTIQSLFDMALIRYTGPNALGAALGMDKYAFGGTCDALGIAHLDRKLFIDGSEIDFEGPYIMKPRYGGSSIGIDVVADVETAKARMKSNVHFKTGAVVEPYREDLFDLQIAVKTHPTLTLSQIERPLRDRSRGEILSYKDKYVGGSGMVEAPRELPAKLAPHIEEKMKNYATLLAKAVPLRGVTRIDFLSNGEDELYVNEVNTIPGSLSKYLFIEPPLPFTQLLEDLISEALAAPTYTPNAIGADGTALNSASSIASKLA
jgi:D-alanine-D-alanine ligase